VIYHEGRKHRIESVILAGDFEQLLDRGRFCLRCGYAHGKEAIEVDLYQ
jgi:hypothetical protein